MIRVRKLLLFLFLYSMICIGCGKEQHTEKQQQEVLAAFDGKQETLIEQEKTEGGLTFVLHHVAFEGQKIIVDYTVKADDIADYKDCKMSTQFDSTDIGLGTVLFYEETEGEYRVIWVYELNEGRFAEKNIGDMVQLDFFFVTASYNQGVDRTINFEVEIQKIYQNLQIGVQKEIAYEGGITRIEALEVSPFYTRLLVENERDFLLDGEDFYLYEIKMTEDKVLQPITGTENALYFSILPSDSSKVFISVVKYNEDMTYDAVSDRLEVEIL